MDDYEILATIAAFDVFDLPAITAYCTAGPEDVADVVHRFGWLFEQNGQHQTEPTWRVRYPEVLRKLLTQLRPADGAEAAGPAVTAPSELAELPPAQTLVLPPAAHLPGAQPPGTQLPGTPGIQPLARRPRTGPTSS